ncbi:MAG: zinc ribbon domain-containing protein [Clostridia bacterium]|nr:zinc ribbon domain-containing protein [Clostridia bacterium]
MNCPNCNAVLTQDDKFCTNCGQPVAQNIPENASEAAAPATPAPVMQEPVTYPQPQVYSAPVSQQNDSQKYKLLSPRAYVGYNILFSIPVIGFILLLVFCFSDENLNRRNYARSFFCSLIIGIFIFILALILSAAFGFSLMELAEEYM